MKLYSLDTGLFKLDGGAMHGVVPKSMWQKVNPADEQNMCSWAMRCLLIEDDHRLILIDTGMGNKQDEKFFSHFHPHGSDTLNGSLRKYGFSEEDVTDVILTHLHFDHCGGAIRREGQQLVPTFPKAQYWSNDQHWYTALHPNVRERASFLKENIHPIEASGQLNMIALQQDIAFNDDIRIRFVQGHTDAMMLPLIHYKGHTLLYAADLIPSLAHLSLPWVMAYDMRPLDTLAEKEALLQEAVAHNWLIFFEHDRQHECCSLMQTDKGIRHQELIRVADL